MLGEKMDYEVILERNHLVCYHFTDGNYYPTDSSEEEPVAILGKILIGDKRIGSICLYELYNEGDVFDQCDSVSADCANIAEAICGKSGRILSRYLSGESQYEPVYILDQIEISKEYRNQGIGSTIIKNLLNMLNYQYGYGRTLFLCASDYESSARYGFDSDEYKNGKKRLIRFYKRIGFRVVKDNIMVLNKKDD